MWFVIKFIVLNEVRFLNQNISLQNIIFEHSQKSSNIKFVVIFLEK